MNLAQITKEFCEIRPYGGFDLLMIDPPWLFKVRSKKGEGKSPQGQYACLTIDQIKSLPIDALAGTNSLLWLWATNPMLPQALDVMAAWGFSFKTAGHWTKRTKHGKLNFGTGYYLRCAGEPFLIGTRGRVKTTRSTRSVIDGKIREHSRKPEEAFAAAEALMPDAKRIEVFSRAIRPGWTVWGNETDKFAEAPE